MPDLKIMIVRKGMTVPELRSLVRSADFTARETHLGFLLMVSGFDSDPRDLWEIDDAIGLMNSLVEVGCLSALAPNLPMSPGYQPSMMGAFQLWMFTHRPPRGGEFLCTKKMLEEFRSALLASNNLMDAAINN
jgi:hypothetical protein